jgi:hypothetical protein
MRHNLDLLFKFTLFLNSVVFFWKLLVSDSVLGISETFPCSMSVVQEKISLLLDTLRVLLLCVVALFVIYIYVVGKRFLAQLIHGFSSRSNGQ